MLMVAIILFTLLASSTAFSNGNIDICDPTSKIFGCLSNETGTLLPSSGSSTAANKLCKKQGQIMWWVASPVRSQDYTVRSSDIGNDPTKDPTTYVPNAFMHIFVRTLTQGRQYGGIILRATDSNNRVVGEFEIPSKNNHPYWTPDSCPGAVLHATGNLKPYLAEIIYKTPPTKTGTIKFSTLIKRGEANTGEFYYPSSDLILQETSTRSTNLLPLQLWNISADGQSCDQYCSLSYSIDGSTQYAYECDPENMKKYSKSSETLANSIAGRYPIFKPIISDCGQISPAIRESDDMSFYHDETCIEGSKPSCTAYATGIKRLCLCKKRNTGRRMSTVHEKDIEKDFEIDIENEQLHLKSSNSVSHRASMFSISSFILFTCVTLLLIAPIESHNWVETPSRARSRASTTRPCQIRKSSDLHAQIGKDQDHVIKYAAGHGKETRWAIVKGEDEHWLSHPDFKTMLLDYLDKAPESSNMAFDPKWKRYHAADSSSCDTTTTAPDCLKDFTYMTDPNTVKDSDIVPNSGWCDDKTDLTTCALFSRRVPSTDPYFVDHALEPTEWNVGNQKRGALFEYRETTLKKAGDKRVMYQSKDYPWLVGAFSYKHLASMPSTVDVFRVNLPSWATAGHYVINWWWAGYYDAVDFDYIPSKSTIPFPYGDVECGVGSIKSQACLDIQPLKPCCPTSRNDGCKNTRFCLASPAIFNKIDHCQYVNPSLFVTQAKIIHKNDNVQKSLDEIQTDWYGSDAAIPLNRAGVVCSPLILPDTVKVVDTLVEAAKRNVTAMMKHENNIAPLNGIKDEVTAVNWNNWFGSGSATSTSGKTCASYQYGSSSSSRFYLGTLREAVLRCTGHECRGVVWVPRTSETSPGIIYETHPVLPLQFQFCKTDDIIDDVNGKVAIMKETKDVWKSSNRVSNSPIHKINFMKKTSTLTLLPGWTKDTGEKFGDRGNGMEYGWNYDVSDPHVLSGVDPTCTSSKCRQDLMAYSYLQTSTWTSKGTSPAKLADRERAPTRQVKKDVYDTDRIESLDTTMFIFQYNKGERVPRRAINTAAKIVRNELDVSRPPLLWRSKVPNGVYNITIMMAWDIFFDQASRNRQMLGSCSIEQSKIDYYPNQWKELFGGTDRKFSELTDHDNDERKAHIRNLIVVVRDGYLDLTTSAVVTLTENDNVKFSGGLQPRCHSISWLTYQKIGVYPPTSKPGRWPSAWYPSVETPWFQRDLGSKKKVRVVRITPPTAPTSSLSEYPTYKDRNRNSPHSSYTGRGKNGFYDTCRSRFLFDGDTCVGNKFRGREQGNWDHAPEKYGYRVTVGDVPCTVEPCPIDLNAHVCRPLPGLTEWSLGAPESASKTKIIDQKIARPQTPKRPDAATFSTLQLNYYLPWSENGAGAMDQLHGVIHDCGDVEGKYVRVQLHGNNRIVDFNVEIIGDEIVLPNPDTDQMIDHKICFGVLARTARSLPTPLMEYQVSDDPNDPVYYSTCYVREPKRLWQLQKWHIEKPIPKSFRLETTCLSCTSYAESNKIQNSTYVPDWTLNEQCTNCDRIKSTLNYQEHVLLEPSNINGNSTTCDLLNSKKCLESTVCDMIEDKCESVTIGNNLSTNIIIGVAVGGGLLFILGGIVIFIVVMKKIKYGSNNNSRSKRKGTIELIEETETEDEKAYRLSRKLEKKQSRATDFYGTNHDLITVNANFRRYSADVLASGCKPPIVSEKNNAIQSGSRHSRERSWHEVSMWKQEIDKDQETYYYFNAQTCESIWEAPEGFVKCEWQIVMDDVSQKIYYSNEKSGETSWSINDTQEDFQQGNPMNYVVN